MSSFSYNFQKSLIRSVMDRARACPLKSYSHRLKLTSILIFQLSLSILVYKMGEINTLNLIDFLGLLSQVMPWEETRHTF